MAKVLCDFQDVFAIEHSIDTGMAKTVKQKIRRTHACLAGEDEAHLKILLDAGVKVHQ
ncbi:hypothetical protein DPMN_049889 [Dreissena polymorpha]|uniref:Uncharacterized protein n=1 Tax=Dreissena polymorpha TaxID=45954 RepID=A0A9D4CGI2_DREPO|nr:hypothetical protein DPMN_049889 [Dreissena polymorpha]